MDYSLLLGIEKVVKQEIRQVSISDNNIGGMFFNQMRNGMNSSKGNSSAAESSSKNTSKGERKERPSSVHLNTSYW